MHARRSDSELAVDPGVDLAVSGSVAAGELGDEPVALVSQLRAALERRDPVDGSGSGSGEVVAAGACARGAGGAGGPNRVICGATSALSGSNRSASPRSVSSRSARSNSPRVLILGRPERMAKLLLGRSRRDRAGPGLRGYTASWAPTGCCRDRAHEAADDLPEDQRGLGRRRVDPDPQAGDVDALGDHVHRDDPWVAGVA